MTHEEIRSILMEKLAQAKKKLELSPNACDIFVNNEITYMTDDFEEHDEYNEVGDTTLLATITVSIRDRYEENDPTFSHCTGVDLKNATVKDPGTIEGEIAEFEAAIDKFSKLLDNTDDVAALITSESERLEKEAEALVKEMEESLNRMKRFGFITLFGIVALIIIILIVKSVL